MTAKGPYRKPRREIAKREIRKLIIDQGLTNTQISERLNIPQRTIERYISDIYEHDNQLLASINSNELMLTRTNVCRDRMDNHRQEVLTNIARNPNASFRDQIAAWNLIAELEAAELRLLANSAALVVRKSPLPLRRYMLMRHRDEEEEQEQEGRQSDKQNEEQEQEQEPTTPKQDPRKLVRAVKDEPLTWH